MQPRPQSGPHFWLRAALWFTTAKLRVPGPVTNSIGHGWDIRTAAPKWVCVWHSYPEAQRQLRTIVMPRPRRGRFDPVWQALLHQSLYDFGLRRDEPNARLFAQAKSEFFARLAPPWTNLMAGPYK
ncbi:hypothetical protein [Paracoccus onubensis]|uniref:Uncharacterized protein n=1 Tax=Paracoccus onubensis TaxID=1675788 RepID=A0A418T4T9_9RHOB|nr:hypothetical protein [Paracoccus onubensis]RJE88120.1 hypothetical protein D3P04_04190 [Paracoccus onubensis]